MSKSGNKSKTKIIVVTSGKGGVGKTTTSASIAMGLANLGKKTVVIDFDIGLRNLDIVMGCERRVVYDFVHVMQDIKKLNQALIKVKDNENLFILAASQTHDKDVLDHDKVFKVLNELRSKAFEYIICDSPAGIEGGAKHAMYYADMAIVVSNPEVSSIRDSDRVVGLLDSRTKKSEDGGEVEKYLLVTRYDAERVKRDEMLSIEDVNDILALPLIGVIPESEDVVNSSNKGLPVIANKDSLVAKCYMDCVERILGNDVEFRDLNSRKSLFSKIFRS
jgi:septum site-determining protein MinD